MVVSGISRKGTILLFFVVGCVAVGYADGCFDGTCNVFLVLIFFFAQGDCCSVNRAVGVCARRIFAVHYVFLKMW